MYDYLVVGAGFAGVVLAERLSSSGNQVLIVEKRDHIGGNCYDFYDEAGILVHKYGPHIFHTNSEIVWKYLSRFTEWITYEHRVLANYNGEIFTLPVNLNTIQELFKEPQAKRIKERLIDSFGRGQKVPILKLQESKDPGLKILAETVYEKIYLNYTKKQWGVTPEELDSLVTERVPLWTDWDKRYFRDKYQGIPKAGYTKMMEKMLDNSNIEIILNRDGKELINQVEYKKIIYTGPIDYFFNYKYGKLPYRSLRFEFETLGQGKFQEVAVVNYTGSDPFTRITEFKHLTGQSSHQTTILREYPQDYLPDKNIPCYPIPQKKNFLIYAKYLEETKHHNNIVFIGRLAEYRYYNMDEVIAKALKVVRSSGWK